MEKYGIIMIRNVSVERELNGMVIFVLLYRNALVEPFGIKIHGLVNVHPLLYGMGNIVLLILVLVANFGMLLREDVNVLMI